MSSNSKADKLWLFLEVIYYTIHRIQKLMFLHMPLTQLRLFFSLPRLYCTHQSIYVKIFEENNACYNTVYQGTQKRCSGHSMSNLVGLLSLATRRLIHLKYIKVTD